MNHTALAYPRGSRTIPETGPRGAPLVQAIVDLDAVAHNTRIIRGIAGRAQIMAVVKANGYGHGAAEVARTVLDNGASWLATTTTADAVTLRAGGVSAPILAWLYAPDDGLADALAARIDVSASSVSALERIASAARRDGRAARVHLEADTGMARGGASAHEWPGLMSAARGLETGGAIRVVGLWSHFAMAEEPEDDGVRQLRSFADFRRSAVAAGLTPAFVHIANSAGTLRFPQSRFNVVRVGRVLYGDEPMPDMGLGLRPAMTVTARVLGTRRVPAGTGVSYGWDHVTDRETSLALIPFGFADGVPRQANGRACVWLRGRRLPIVGRITMDQSMVDVGDLPVEPGETVVMFGPGNQGEPTVQEWATWADTNVADILTGISARVPRRYLPVGPLR